MGQICNRKNKCVHLYIRCRTAEAVGYTFLHQYEVRTFENSSCLIVNPAIETFKSLSISLSYPLFDSVR